MSFLAAFIAGALGAMGLGGGGVLLLYLVSTGTAQATAQGINLLFILPVGLAGLYLHRKNGLAELRTAAPVLLGGVPGAVLGCLLLVYIPTQTLSVAFGWLVIAVGIREAVLGIRAIRHSRNNSSSSGEE